MSHVTGIVALIAGIARAAGIVIVMRSFKAAEFIALANDDLVFLPGAINVPVAYLAEPAQRDVAMVGLRTLYPDGTLQRSTYPTPTPARALIALTCMSRT